MSLLLADDHCLAGADEGDPLSLEALAGTVAKKDLSNAEIQIIVDLFQQLKPRQIYAAGDLSDPHGTHRTCLQVWCTDTSSDTRPAQFGNPEGLSCQSGTPCFRHSFLHRAAHGAPMGLCERGQTLLQSSYMKQ